MIRLAKQYGAEPPRELGLNAVKACEAILAGKIKAPVMLGGSFVRAIPDHGRCIAAHHKGNVHFPGGHYQMAGRRRNLARPACLRGFPRGRPRMAARSLPSSVA